MSIRSVFSAMACVGFLGLGGCGSDEDDFGTAPPQETEPDDVAGTNTADEPGVGDPSLDVFADEEVAMVVQTVNLGEVRQSRLAFERASHPEVRRFAAMMILAHTVSQNRWDRLARDMELVPWPSPLSRQVGARGRVALAELEKLTGDAFDRRYMQMQLGMHAEFLTTSRKQLMPGVESARVQKLLRLTDEDTAAHLREGFRVAAQLDSDRTRARR